MMLSLATVRRTSVSVGILCAAAISGCSDEKPGDSVAAAAAAAGVDARAETLLGYVPSDAAYAFAMLQPMPADVGAKVEAMLGAQLESYSGMMARALNDIQESDSDEVDPLLLATLEEMSTRMSVQGLRSMGYDIGAVNAIYGVGLLPVMRMTLSDTAGFESFIAAVEERADQPFQSGSAGGVDYRYFDLDDEFRVLFTTAQGHLVAALVPSGLGAENLARVIGSAPPQASMVDDNRLAQLNAEYDWLPHGTGYLDIAAVVQALLRSEDDPLSSELRSLMRWGEEEISDACRTEMREMAEVVPRIVSGMRQYDTDALVNQTLIRLRDDIASGLTNLAVPLPGIDDTDAGLLSMGVSFRLLALKEFAQTRVDAIQNDPYQCEWFADLNNVEAASAQLQQPIPPFISVFKGFRFILDDLQMNEDQAYGVDPKGRVLIAMDNPQMLLGMAQMMSPELAALELKPDGKPVALPTDSLPAGSPQPYLAMTDAGIAIGVGDEGARLRELLEAPEPADDEATPVLTFGYDLGALGDLMNGVSKMNPDADEMPEQELEELKQILGNQMFERVGASVYFSPAGVDVRYRGTIK